MKTIYALIAACLSLQACNNSAPTASSGITAEGMVTMSLYEDDTAIVATVPAQPIPGAEFESSSHDDYTAAWTTIYIDDFGYTATVPTSALPKAKRTETTPGFYIDEDGGIVYENDTPPLP
jgi:hypothetical protein